MSEVWLNFVIAFLVQLSFFIVHAFYEKKLPDISRVLGRGVLGGIVLGLLFDLIVGRFFGLWSYTPGFTIFFLILNAALVYGLFVANTLLMQQARIVHFFIWTIAMGAVLDITNLFFHVWTWKFPFVSVGFLIIFVIGNLGTAVLIATTGHILFGYRFRFITDLLKK